MRQGSDRRRGRHASPIQTSDPNISFFSAWSWDGADRKGAPVPNGDYNLVFSVLKPLGDETNPAHWQSWTSGTVTVTGSTAKEIRSGGRASALPIWLFWTVYTILHPC